MEGDYKIVITCEQGSVSVERCIKDKGKWVADNSEVHHRDVNRVIREFRKNSISFMKEKENGKYSSKSF